MRQHNLPIDFAGFHDHGECVLLAEAAGVEQDSPEWAAKLRRDRLARDPLPSAEYFVVAGLNNIYLWKESAPTDALPHLRLETARMFAKALGRSAKSLNLREMESEMFRDTLGL